MKKGERVVLYTSDETLYVTLDEDFTPRGVATWVDVTTLDGHKICVNKSHIVYIEEGGN